METPRFPHNAGRIGQISSCTASAATATFAWRAAGRTPQYRRVAKEGATLALPRKPWPRPQATVPELDRRRIPALVCLEGTAMGSAAAPAAAPVNPTHDVKT